VDTVVAARTRGEGPCGVGERGGVPVGWVHVLVVVLLRGGARAGLLGRRCRGVGGRVVVVAVGRDVLFLLQFIPVLVSAAAGNKSTTRPPFPPPACGGK